MALNLARGRVAIGVVSLLAPASVGSMMTGPRGVPRWTTLFVRTLGAPDLGMGARLLMALSRGAPVRGWLEASALADGIDAAAFGSS